jgi:hypothetical protein
MGIAGVGESGFDKTSVEARTFGTHMRFDRA